MLLNLYVGLLTLLLTPQTQIVNVRQANQVLDVSALIRIKRYEVDPETTKVKRGMSGCSGTFVSGNQVLTAAHCFRDTVTDIWVRPYDVKIGFPAKLIKLDMSHDLALLQVDNMQKHPYAQLAKKVRVGEQVINVGSPLGFEFLVSEGVVAALSFKVREFKARYTITTAMINPGSSGGGAFNSAGDLIGVNTMSVGMFGWTGISMAVERASIEAFLRGEL